MDIELYHEDGDDMAQGESEGGSASAGSEHAWIERAD